MPRPARPFRNEPRPIPPDPIHYVGNAQGLVVARHVYKKRYDAWWQRRRRAIARGECTLDDQLSSAAAVPTSTQEPAIPQLSAPHPTSQHSHAMVPVGHGHHANAPPSNVMLMIPASMVSLLTRPVEFP